VLLNDCAKDFMAGNIPCRLPPRRPRRDDALNRTLTGLHQKTSQSVPAYRPDAARPIGSTISSGILPIAYNLRSRRFSRS